MSRYILDTNHIGEAVGRVSVVRDRVQQLQHKGDVFGTCGPVLCELFVGLEFHKDASKCITRLNKLLKTICLWPTELSIAMEYAKIYHELQRMGRALSQVDILVAAMARHLNATLLTTDQDFLAIHDLRIENWLVK